MHAIPAWLIPLVFVAMFGAALGICDHIHSRREARRRLQQWRPPVAPIHHPKEPTR